MKENKPPEFDADTVRSLSITVYKMRLVAESGEGAVERMIAKDKDDGRMLSNRAAAYDALSRCYLRALKSPALTPAVDRSEEA